LVCHIGDFCITPRKGSIEIIDAWVEEWRRMNPSKPTERSIIADITALLAGLSEDGTRRVQAEVNIALAGRRLPKITRPAAEMLCDYPERRISVAWSQN
jgi:hypothetical protein